MAKWVLGILLAIIVLTVGIAGCNYAASWGNKAGEVLSPDHVEQENTEILDLYENLTAAGTNACNAKSATSGKDDPTLVEDPSLAYKATYRKVVAVYNRKMENLYEAQAIRKLPLPSNLRGLPERAPTYEQFVEQNC